MTTRKPVLPELTWLATTGGDGGSRFRQATRELHAATAALREAWRIDVLHTGTHTAGTAPKVCPACRFMLALARLDNLQPTRRPTRRTP